MRTIEDKKARNMEIVCGLILFALLAGLTIWGVFPKQFQMLIAMIF